MSVFVDEVLAALPHCKAAADYYRIHVAVENHATPADVAALAANPALQRAGDFGPAFVRFAARLGPVPETGPVFRARRLGASMTFYAGVDSPAAVILAFCGKADRLFIPLPAMLGYFAPDRHGLLVLRDPARAGFTTGINGHSASFRELIDRLRDEPVVAAAPSLAAFGTSAGGSPALAAGLLLGATTAVSFSGHLATASPVHGSSPAAAAFDDILRDAPPQPQFVCVYGADNRIDAQHAMGLAQVFPVGLLPVSGVADHNVVHAIQKRGQLASLLRTVGLTA